MLEIPIHLLLVGVERVNLLEEITKKKNEKNEIRRKQQSKNHENKSKYH